MIEDILFSKIYNNKNYLTKLFEARNKISYDAIIENIFSKNAVYYKDFDEEKITLVIKPHLYYIEKNTNDIKNKMRKNCQDVIATPPYSPLSNFIKLKSDNDDAQYYAYGCVKYITLNYKTGFVLLRADIVYFPSDENKSYTNDIDIERLLKIDNQLVGTSLSDLSKSYNREIKDALLQFSVINKNKDLDKNNINDEKDDTNKDEQKSTKKYIHKPAPNLWKYNVDITDDTTEKSKSDLTMHIKSYKDSKGVLPFLYTNEVVTDDRARKYQNVCDMVENNVAALEEKLLTNLASTVKYNKNNINMQNDMRKDIHKEYEDNYEERDGIKYVKSFDNYLNGISSHQDLKHLSKISINVCDVYLRAMADAKKFVFDKDYINSKGLNYNLHLYLTEILSPLAVVANKCHWNKLHENEGFEVFRDYVKLPENNDFVNEAYINYPTESNFPLADSAIYINGYRLYVSTKAGLNGLGAQASIKSLHQFMHNPENPNELTGLAQEMKNTYPEQFALFEMFLTKGVNYLNWKEISKITNNQVSTKFELQKYVNLNKDVYTTIIMKVLQAAAFQFVQVNCKASSTTDNFHFDYRVQYPAVFKGNVDIEIPDKGYIKFHIVEAQ